MFQSRMRRKGKRCGEIGHKHKRLFPKKADSEGKILRWDWLAAKREMNFERTRIAGFII